MNRADGAIIVENAMKNAGMNAFHIYY